MAPLVKETGRPGDFARPCIFAWTNPGKRRGGGVRFTRKVPVYAAIESGGLMGTFGPETVRVPRARLEAPDGKTAAWKNATIRAYPRRTKRADALIAGAYFAGTNARRVRRALAALFGGVVSPVDDSSSSTIFGSLRLAGWAATYASRSFWWTMGGVEFRPMALATRHMPRPALFSGMPTGNFLAY